MSKVDVSRLKTVFNMFSDLCSDLMEAYHLNWNDSVHSSFELYNISMNESVNDLHDINECINEISRATVSIEPLMKRVDGILKEVNRS